MQENSPIIIDNGSFTIKAGFLGQDVPQALIPNMIGYPKHSIDMRENYYVG